MFAILCSKLQSALVPFFFYRSLLLFLLKKKFDLILEEIHTECESPSKIVEKYQLTCQTSSIPWPLVPTVLTEGCFETFKVLTLNTLYALQTNTGEPHITSMMFAHGGLPKRFVPVLGLEGDIMDFEHSVQTPDQVYSCKSYVSGNLCAICFLLPVQGQTSASQQTYLSPG